MLFGANPTRDYQNTVQQFGGRRVNLSAVDRSLLLLKATAEVPHEGGRRKSRNSPEYSAFRQWLEQGAALDDVGQSLTTGLSIETSVETIGIGESYSVRVCATFADSTVEDVTHLCTFASKDTSIVSVNRDGVVTADGVGDATIIVRYRSTPAVARALNTS